ncbi:alpha/beta hydrolase [Paenibacillus sp. ACRRX]|uniref:alpha/beta hydrolase n=1 Tax=Paenibacillus sp. ACRRX TaxID=2918206 RepID=UPI001EF696EC|nr:alpha/beta hydrolase [Paenibacillus sp. ACRRX]MCG7408462.1 alpha/beta hydrolase [Paenibacillus sp. ACRRX]
MNPMNPCFSDEDEQDLCLWIHGWGVSADIWRTAAESFPHFEHHYISFRDCQTVEEMIDAVRLLPEIAAAGRSRRRFHVIGWSMGGMLAIDAAVGWLSNRAQGQTQKQTQKQIKDQIKDQIQNQARKVIEAQQNRTTTDVEVISSCVDFADSAIGDKDRAKRSAADESMTNAELISVVLVGTTLSFVDDTGAAGWPKRIVERMRTRLLQSAELVLHDFQAKFWSASERGGADLQPVPALSRQPLAAADFSPAGLNAGLAYLLQADLHEAWSRLRSTDVPVLWLHGAEDPLCPLRAQERAAAYRGRGKLAMRVIASAGHAPFLTARDHWNQELSAWFQYLSVRKEGEQHETTPAFSDQ